MNGEVAQLVALVAHGNRFLRTGAEPPELFPDSSEFGFVSDVRFGEATGTAAWFEHLRGRGVERLWLFLPAARPELAGFANATRGAIWADGPAREIWQARWEVGDRRAPDRRIWAVEYATTPDAPPVPDSPDAGEAAAELASALGAAAAVAARDEFLSTFAGWFSTALEALAADDPVVEYHPDLLPAGWSLEGRRLLAAAAAAWVFGGMGSWNDVSFPQDAALARAHEEVIARLYRAVCAAVTAGANEPAAD